MTQISLCGDPLMTCADVASALGVSRSIVAAHMRDREKKRKRRYSATSHLRFPDMTRYGRDFVMLTSEFDAWKRDRFTPQTSYKRDEGFDGEAFAD